MVPPEIVVAGITAMSAISVALVAKQGGMAKDIRDTKEQVQNSHSTNLRDDLDAIHESVRHTMQLVETLYQEVHLERRERMALAERLDDHLTE